MAKKVEKKRIYELTETQELASGMYVAVDKETLPQAKKIDLHALFANVGGVSEVSIDSETGYPDVDNPNPKIMYVTRDEDSGTYTQWIWYQPEQQEGSWVSMGQQLTTRFL